MRNPKLYSNVFWSQGDSQKPSAPIVRNRALEGQSDLGRPKRAPSKADKILDKSPSVLDSKQKAVLFKEIDRLYRIASKKWMKIGEIAAFIVEAEPEKTFDDRKKEFDQKLKMSYGLAMRAKRLYEFYAATPHEVENYGADAADRLRQFDSEQGRKKVWKATGSVNKLKEHLQRGKRGQPKKVVRIKADGKSHELFPGLDYSEFKVGGLLHVDFTIISREKFLKALSAMTGQEYTVGK